MGMINLGSSLRYGPHGKRRKTKAFSKPSKHKQLIRVQQKLFDQVMREIKEEYPSYEGKPLTGNITPKKEVMHYTGERKLIGIATMHKSNAVPIFEDDKQHAIDIARMRR